MYENSNNPQPAPLAEEKPKSEEALAVKTAMQEHPKLTVNHFELLKTIGKGTFGKVFEVSFGLSLESVIFRFE